MIERIQIFQKKLSFFFENSKTKFTFVNQIVQTQKEKS
jgi:hypothetical protein